MEKKKKTFDPDEVLLNEPWELDLGKLGVFKIRLPTRRERIEAVRKTRSLEFYNQLSPEEKILEENCRIALKCIVEPEIPGDILDRGEVVEDKLVMILNRVWGSIQERLREFQREISSRDFLEEKNGKEQ